MGSAVRRKRYWDHERPCPSPWVGPCPGGRVEQPTKLWAAGTWQYIARARHPVTWIVAYRESGRGTMGVGRGPWALGLMPRDPDSGPILLPSMDTYSKYHTAPTCPTKAGPVLFIFFVIRCSCFRAPCPPVPSFLPHLISTSPPSPSQNCHLDLPFFFFFFFWPLASFPHPGSLGGLLPLAL